MNEIAAQLGLLFLVGGLALGSCQKKPEPGSDIQTMEQGQRIIAEPGMEEQEQLEGVETKNTSLKEEMTALESDLEQLGDRMENIMEGIEDKSAQNYEESIERMKNLQKRAQQRFELTAKNMEKQSAQVRDSMKKATRDTLNELKEAIEDLQNRLDNEEATP